MLISCAAGFVVLNIDYRKLAAWSYLLYFGSLVLLVAVLVLGNTKFGAQRWIRIYFFSIQPSEFAKATYILALANYLANNRYKLYKPGGFLVPILITAVPFVLILVEPDLGTSFMLIPVFFCMMYAAGARLKYLAILALSGILSFPVFWHLLRDYQKQRLMVFLDPNIDPLGAGYTVIQSKIAIGSGGIFGKGWLSGTQNQLNFLPERHSDFIFSVIGEEWGFMGASVVIALFVIFIFRSFNIINRTNDSFGRLLCAGIVTAVIFQVFFNIAMTMGFMPVVGLPLPLLSYGGSSLLTTVISVALLLNVGMKSSIFSSSRGFF
jgi:rod shape determining protein RodA